MTLLLINTVSEPAVVAVALDQNIVAAAELAGRHRLSETLLRQVDAVLVQSSQALSKLTAIGVVNGPGPFTGLRIGVATANALASVSATPLVAIPAAQAATSSDAARFVAAELAAGRTQSLVQPEYGREPTITLPRSS